jgi:phosphoglucosamine mutase
VAHKYFGTDGIRGDADALLTDELVERLGRAAASVLGSEGARMAIIRDTRASGPRIERALARGAARAGADVMLAGVLPTPAAVVLIERLGFDLVAVVSASHNPHADNGVKFFGAGGLKLTDEVEARVEAAIDRPPADAEREGTVEELHGGEDDYLRALQKRFEQLDLGGLRIALDTANGATYRVAPNVMRGLGAEVTVFADGPDGTNINEHCGSTHVEQLAAVVAAGDFDAGFAFDGDGDRLIAVDADGAVVDGDEILAIAALHLRSVGRLPGDGVAVTVMTNYGFHNAMREAGVNVEVTDVGDRHVLEALLAKDWALGGEQSGHLIDRGFVPTGDGTASALLVLEAMRASDSSLRELVPMVRLPQTLINVPVRDRDEVAGATAVWDAVAAADDELDGRGRVLVRPSGTEPLVRVMVEAPTAEEADAICTTLATLIHDNLSSLG